MNHTVVVYPGTDSTFFVAPRIKALSNEVNKRFHDLESQMHKTNFDAASVFARLDSVEAEPVRNSRGSKTHVLFGDSFGGYSATLVTHTQMWKMLKLRILIAFQTYNKGIPCQTTLVVPGPFCMFYISRILYSYSRCCPPADLSVLSLQNLQDSPDSRVQRFDILWLCFLLRHATSIIVHSLNVSKVVVIYPMFVASRYQHWCLVSSDPSCRLIFRSCPRSCSSALESFRSCWVRCGYTK